MYFRILLLFGGVSNLAWSGDGALRLNVKDADQAFVKQVVLAPASGGDPCDATNATGQTVLHYHFEAKPPYKVTLIVRLPENRFFFLSPFDGRVPVPPCAFSETECFETVILGRKTHRLAKADLGVLAKTIALSPELLDQDGSKAFRQEVIRSIGAQLEINASDLDEQLTAWTLSPSTTADLFIASLLRREPIESQGALLESFKVGRKPDQLAFASLVQAKSSYQRQDFEASVRFAKDAAAYNPRDPTSLNLWGTALAKSGDNAGALALLTTTPPGSLASEANWYNAGIAQTRLGRFDSAKQSFNSVVDTSRADFLRDDAEQQIASLKAPDEHSSYDNFFGPPFIAIVVFALLVPAIVQLWARQRVGRQESETQGAVFGFARRILNEFARSFERSISIEDRYSSGRPHCV